MTDDLPKKKEGKAELTPLSGEQRHRSLIQKVDQEALEKADYITHWGQACSPDAGVGLQEGGGYWQKRLDISQWNASGKRTYPQVPKLNFIHKELPEKLMRLILESSSSSIYRVTYPIMHFGSMQTPVKFQWKTLYVQWYSSTGWSVLPKCRNYDGRASTCSDAQAAVASSTCNPFRRHDPARAFATMIWEVWRWWEPC